MKRLRQIVVAVLRAVAEVVLSESTKKQKR
jgi:hypothetical protein